MSQLGYFYGKEADQFSFFTVPKILFKDTEYKDMPCEAKMLYGMMLDRMSLSIENQWFDEQKRAFIKVSEDFIMENLGCGRNKALNLMKILLESGLIERKKMGQGKSSIIYVKRFIRQELAVDEVALEESVKRDMAFRTEALYLQRTGSSNLVIQRRAPFLVENRCSRHRKVRTFHMKKRMTKLIAALVVSAIMTTAGGVTAFAYVDPSAETQTEASASETEVETVLPEEAEESPNTDGSAFTVPGNAQLQDDITDDSSKEFLTIQTKNNNTFYVIIDRSANTENVYMLSQIDENDLAKFLDEGTLTGSSVVTANPGVVLEEKEVEPTTPETEKPEEKEEAKPATGNAAGIRLCP